MSKRRNATPAGDDARRRVRCKSTEGSREANSRGRTLLQRTERSPPQAKSATIHTADVTHHIIQYRHEQRRKQSVPLPGQALRLPPPAPPLPAPRTKRPPLLPHRRLRPHPAPTTPPLTLPQEKKTTSKLSLALPLRGWAGPPERIRGIFRDRSDESMTRTQSASLRGTSSFSSFKEGVSVIARPPAANQAGQNKPLRPPPRPKPITDRKRVVWWSGGGKSQPQTPLSPLPTKNEIAPHKGSYKAIRQNSHRRHPSFPPAPHPSVPPHASQAKRGSPRRSHRRGWSVSSFYLSGSQRGSARSRKRAYHPPRLLAVLARSRGWTLEQQKPCRVRLGAVLVYKAVTRPAPKKRATWQGVERVVRPRLSVFFSFFSSRIILTHIRHAKNCTAERPFRSGIFTELSILDDKYNRIQGEGVVSPSKSTSPPCLTHSIAAAERFTWFQARHEQCCTYGSP